MSGKHLDPGSGPEDDLTVYQAILDTLSGPRVLWRGGEPSVDMSAFDRPFSPAVTPSAAGLVSRRASA